MVKKIRKNLEKRPDLLTIIDIIPNNVKILDLGCGNGSLLKLLKLEKNVRGLGVEISQDKILECAEMGINVIHEDLNEGLKIFADKSFDFVLLSQTLQALQNPDLVLQEMVRVGKKGIISFINIGHISSRAQLFFQGKMPETKTIPNPWYNTPNIHLATIKDFKKLCKDKNLKIDMEIPLCQSFDFLAKFWPNLFAPTCVFVVSQA